MTAPLTRPPGFAPRPSSAARRPDPLRRVLAGTTLAASPPPSLAPPAGADSRARLDAALEDLAEVLAVYPFRAGMPACTHCVTDHDVRMLAGAPATIPGDVLARYVAKCLTTWGTVDDFKRLLPEILRRTVEGRLAVPEPLIGARLRRGGWLSWPAAETPAIHRTLHAAWLTVLDAPPGAGVPVVNRLGLIMSAEHDIDAYLDLWEDRLEAPGDPTARLHAVLQLADLLGPFADGRWRRLTRAFPLARRGVVGQLDRWLRQPAVVQRVAHASEVLRSTPQGPAMARGREGMGRLRVEA